MAWVSKEVIYTSTSTDYETAATFQGSGITNNVLFKVSEPSAEDARFWAVGASLDGTNFWNVGDFGDGRIASSLIVDSDTGSIETGNKAAPFYRVYTFTNVHPKTFTITFSEEI